ncbi:MAG TPA: hypothetical protein VL334_21345 [Anaerolineae bacterium]|nr:hypothetical protein [Anaerolineae bacterium]
MSSRNYRVALAVMVLLALFGLGYYWIQALRQVNGFGFPLDDSWIHLQIARNLASGHGWSYNPGEPTGAATAPLWVLAIAPLFYLGGDVTLWVRAFGILLYLASILLVANVATLASGDRRVGIVAGVLAAAQPAFIWAALSGMETTLYLLLFLLSLRSLFLIEQRGRLAAYASTGWLALAGWARPELWALLPLFWGYMLWRRRDLSVGHWWVHAAIALLAIGSFALFNMALWNHPTPTTLAAKRAHLRSSSQGASVTALRVWASHFFANIDLTLRSQNSVLLTCMAAGLLLIQRRPIVGKRLLLCLGIVVVGVGVISLANLGSVSFQTYRRSAHMLVSMNVLVAAGFVAIYDLLRRLSFDTGQNRRESDARRGWFRSGSGRWGDVAVICLLTTAMVIQVQAVRAWGNRYVSDVRGINQADVAAGQWLAVNTPADAVIAANDVGAIAFFGQRAVFDMVGLASPEVIDVLRRTRYLSEERDRQMKDLLLERQVDYVVIFPAWFPWLAKDPMLHEVQRFTVKNPTALAGEEVVIYQIK